MRPNAYRPGLNPEMLDVGYAELKAYVEGAPRSFMLSEMADAGSTENGQELGSRLAAGFNRDLATATATRGRLRARAINRELNALWHVSAMSVLGDL